MQSNRDASIAETFRWEGGYTNNPSDPGGPTNWGITLGDARRYWKATATAEDVRSMPKDVATSIYAKKYWKTPYYDCDTLASGVDLAVFDFGVNSGPARAKKYLDLSVGGTPAETVTKICDYRLAFLKGLRTFPVFGKGWTSRVAGIKSKSLAWANGTGKSNAGAAAVVIAGGAAVTQSPTHMWPYIIGGTIVAAIVGWLVLGWLHRKTNDVK